MKLVIVESPSKAKTINKYLGKDYKVIASYGHIRQLPSKKGSVAPEEKFKMIWEETAQAKKRLADLTKYVKEANEIYLATDPDREGEAISWHIVNYLKEKRLLKSIPIQRVVFNSITKTNILDAFKTTRDINTSLVDSYLTRVALDYLVGFGISPILWRKMPGSRSAGRVQSVALKLICERENEIEDFKSQEYWSILATLNENNKTNLLTKLVALDGKNLSKLDIKTKEEADNIKIRILKSDFILEKIENKKLNKNPFAPFTTSSMQQDAFNKLGFTTRKTMQLAQKLYEGISLKNETVGLITYMRTDATQIDPSFIGVIRGYIEKQYGKEYLHPSTRIYKTKAKNAQEAHEAIRPTQINYPPEKVKQFLEEDMYKLYCLIWNRSIASQMASSIYDLCSYIISSNKKDITLKANGSILKFDGFYKVYNVAITEEDKNNILPPLKEGANLKPKEVENKQHFTEPPARYSEATLVKKMEELGIGRPSTYANIISVLQQRKYTLLEKKRFIPEPRGRILNIFLNNFFGKYVEYDFTANLEKSLDEVSNSTIKKEKVLNDFWQNFDNNLKKVEQVTIDEIIKVINDNALEHFLGDKTDCPKCKDGKLLIKNSKFGAFIGCSNYPECSYTTPLEASSEEEEEKTDKNRLLGKDNQGKEIFLKIGPYGYYVEKTDDKPKRMGLPNIITPSEITLEQAIFLLELPKIIDEKEDISLSIGRFGPYLKQGKDFFSVKSDIFSLTKEEAKAIITDTKAKKLGKNLGVYPRSKKDIIIKSGRYGAYLVYDKKNIKIPKEHKKQEMTLELAIQIIKDTKNK